MIADNGGPFRSFWLEHFINAHPELRHGRTRAKAPGHDGVRERAFGSLNYERLYREQNDDALDLVRQAVFVSSASGTARVRPQRHGAVG